MLTKTEHDLHGSNTKNIGVEGKQELFKTWNNPNNIQIAEAGVLLIRNGINHILRDVDFTDDDMFEEQINLNLDTKAFMNNKKHHEESQPACTR